jgi:hypothetical protein
MAFQPRHLFFRGRHWFIKKSTNSDSFSLNRRSRVKNERASFSPATRQFLRLFDTGVVHANGYAPRRSFETTSPGRLGLVSLPAFALKGVAQGRSKGSDSLNSLAKEESDISFFLALEIYQLRPPFSRARPLFTRLVWRSSSRLLRLQMPL